ncbi:DEAD/DEAH box helicase [Loigolactobacillus jiayinensis]|uniref:DEAD/DEAH box helicase n=1 Tax=Loigolactobacillus jiayinensis TaxID=2486016 RepID=A0ABW1RF21_9LACO|nr:helicase-related protein [Loigolactobacillus jiayinensis]
MTVTELSNINNIPHLQQRPAMTSLNQNWLICARCGSRQLKQQVQLADGRYYCPNCLLLGRVCSDAYLVSLTEPNKFDVPADLLTWVGQLTPAQQKAAAAIRTYFAQQQDHLLWAVTGAGKTEMLFPGIAWALTQKLRVGIASPRVDVCLELMPRVQAAFANTPIMLLHGRQNEPYRYTQLVLCTTHQLLRFYHAFDVLIIDEVDAFPYAQNPQLAYATQQAVKATGARLFLTATPSPQLLRQVRQKRLALSYLPRRYHGHPLPQPKIRLCLKWRQQLYRQRLPTLLQRLLTNKIAQGQHFLLFIPRIELLAHLAPLLQQQFPDLKFATVHAADPQRLEKVQQMRQQQVSCLVTTTILERGVTFPGIDVIVLGADDAVFSAAALVQMAGRVGRSAARPTGAVDFLCAGLSRSVQQACRQIKQVNRKAGFK